MSTCVKHGVRVGVANLNSFLFKIDENGIVHSAAKHCLADATGAVKQFQALASTKKFKIYEQALPEAP